jgi:UDP-N-acetylmuramate dehydrogenase
MPDSELIQQNVPLAPLTTLRIGGQARFFAEAQNEEDLLAAVSFAGDCQEPIFIMGGGSNLLVADEGVPGLTLRIAIKGFSWRDQGDAVIVTAGAGEDWDDFVRQCVDRELAGVECLSGIPGSVGGTPVQNVGAYGQEVSETIVSVRVFNRSTARFDELSNAECQFSYRASLFNTTMRDRYIVTAVTYALKPHGAPAIRYPDLKNYFSDFAAPPTLGETREAVRKIRARKSMLITPDDPDCRSAGSFFKNPIVTVETLARIEAAAKSLGLIGADERIPNFSASENQVKIPAAWLIERAGFHKGYGDGRVGLSSKHTLAIVNRGAATSRDVIDLMQEIQARVTERFGVSLTPEPVFVGFSPSQALLKQDT